MGRNVFELISRLPKHGVGAKLARTSWKDGSFWAVTDVKLSRDGKHGQVWGQLFWNGAVKDERTTQINGPLKRVWKVVESQAGATQQWESVAAAALRQEAGAAAAARKPAASADAAAPREPAAAEST